MDLKTPLLLAIVLILVKIDITMGFSLRHDSENITLEFEQKSKRFKLEMPKSEKIIGGRPVTSEEEHPWLVSLKGESSTTNKQYICGGVLISKYCVLTAAHCFEGNKKEVMWSARLGSLKGASGLLDKIGNWAAAAADFFTWGTFKDTLNKYKDYEYRIGKIVSHRHYHIKKISRVLTNDIALAIMVKPADIFSQIKSIKLPARKEKSWPRTGQRCKAYGWGCTQQGGGPTDYSRRVTLKIADKAKCSKHWNVRNLVRTRICAGSFKSRVGICKGDSGGPLVCDVRKNGRLEPQLAGISSFRSKYLQAPGVFTRVSNYVHWINALCKNNSPKN